MNSKKIKLSSRELPPPYVARQGSNINNNSIFALLLLTGPLPFLYSLNSVFSFWSLDSFHYILFQALFVALCPTLLRTNVESPMLVDSKTNLVTSPEPKLIEIEKVQEVTVSIETPSVSDNGLQVPSSSINPPEPLHRFSQESELLFEELQTVFDNNQDVSTDWEVIIDTCDPMPISIFRDKTAEHRYRIECTFNNSPATIFDSMSFGEGSSSNSATKKVLQAQEKLETLSPNASILYFMTISVWPTSARDICLLQDSKVLPDGSILSICKSVSHPSKPESSSKGAVRMEAHLAGRWFRPVPNHPNQCKLMGYFYGDPKGWIPKSLVNLAATNLIPKTLHQINLQAELLPRLDSPQSITSYNPGAGTSVSVATGSTICDDDIPEPLTISEEKFVDPSYPPPSQAPEPNANSGPVTLARAQTIAPPPTLWERVQANLTSSWLVGGLVATTGPIVLTAAVVAMILRRHEA